MKVLELAATFQLSGAWLAASGFSILFVILYPLALAIIAQRRFKAGWKYFGYGALIFFLFQLISRVPLVTVLGNALAPQLRSSTTFLYSWLVILAVTAGLFEEVGRYIGYRWLMGREEKTWDKAVMYGLGHGGLESMLLVGGLALLSLVNLVILASIGLNIVPASQRAQVAQQLAAISAQPWWFPLLSAWERLWAVPVQVAFSVIVLQVFRRGSLLWLGLAILAHAVFDFVTVALIQLLGPGKISTNLIAELVVAISGITGLVVTWLLRDRPVAGAEREPGALPEAG